MSESHVKQLCGESREKLKEAIVKLENFLNHYSLKEFTMEHDKDPALEEFYRNYLSDLRHLLVFSEVSNEKLGISLRRPNFNMEYAEKVLYDVYHNVVNKFFFPQNECYSEDGRYAYTGQDAIRFRKKPIREVRDITLEMSKIFEELRDDLGYYETDYITQRLMQGEKV